MKRAVIIWSGPENGTSANLFKALESELSKFIVTVESPTPLSGGGTLAKLITNVRANLARLPAISGADCIVVHSYASLSMLSIVAARILGKKVFVFNWDVYPTTISGIRRGGLLRRIADELEGLALGLATCVIIPSSDFRTYVTHRNLVELPLWPSLAVQPFEGAKSTDVIKIAFAGQADPTRGLDKAIRHICERSKANLQFHIFSSGHRLPVDPVVDKSRCEIIYYDPMSREMVQKTLANMNFGLISLHPELDQPGYPSKVFDYIAANVPILYFGRPLDAFTDAIEESKIGVVLRGDVDLNETYRAAMSNWVERRDMFLDLVRLDGNKLRRIFSIGS